MRLRLETPGGACDNLSTGEWARSIAGSHIESHLGIIKLPEVGVNARHEPILGPRFIRITNVGGFQIAGQSDGTPGTWHYRHGAGWTLDPRIAHGESGCIFDNAGVLRIIEPAANQQTGGYRFVDEAGRLWTGDETKFDVAQQLSEWTRIGDLTIGQGRTNAGGAIALYRGRRYIVETGGTYFIRVRRAGDQIALALVRGGFSILRWFEVADLLSLPQEQLDPIVIPPPPPIDPEEPDPVAIPERQHFDVVARLAATIPHERTLAYAWKLCRAIAWELRHEGCGLHDRPASGENVVTVDGQTYGASRVMYRDGDLYKIVSDAGDGGANGPQWAREEPIDPARWRAPLAPDDVVVDPPVLPPEEGWEVRFQMLQADVTKLETGYAVLAQNAGNMEARITALESRPIGQTSEGQTVEGRTDPAGASFLKHTHTFTADVKATP